MAEPMIDTRDDVAREAPPPTRLADTAVGRELAELRRGHAELRAMVADLRDEVAEMTDQLLDALRGVQGAAVDETQEETAQRRLRSVLRRVLPTDATAAIATAGDDRLLGVSGRTTWHFPRAADGSFTNFHPHDDLAAIAHVEALRAQGADHLVFLESSRWWLDHYEGLRHHLDSRYRRIADDGTCVVYALHHTVARVVDLRSQLHVVVRRCSENTGERPSVLDWGTGWELIRTLPEAVVLEVPADRRTLPYFNDTFDIVVVPEGLPTSAVDDAWHVARAAVVTVPVGPHAPDTELDLRWKVEPPADLPPMSLVVAGDDGRDVASTLRMLFETLPHGVEIEVLVPRQWSVPGDGRVVSVPVDGTGALSTNALVSRASTDVVVLVGAGCLPLPGWLPALARSLLADGVGAVGGLLLSSLGAIAHAGGVVFRDGTAWDVGLGEYALDAPLYNVVRSVDFASDRLLAVRADAWREAGGMGADVPAEWVGPDLGLRLRARGYDVRYQPDAVAVDLHERADVSLEPDPVFLARWAARLWSQPERPAAVDLRAWTRLALAKDGVR